MSKSPVIPMSKDKWITFAKELKYGDIPFVITDDLTAEIIEWGSENNSSVDPNGFVPFLHPAHAFRYLGLGRGATVEADPKGTQWHLIEEYMDRVISGKVRLVVFRHEDLTMEEFENIKTEAERQVGKPYGWGAIIGCGLVKLFRDTIIGKWWREAKWSAPWCDRNAPYCSQGVMLQERNVKRFFELFKGEDWTYDTPQALLNIFVKKEIPMVLDSFKWAKDA
jgi:hypothetical protein